jgi:hypothetical protein
MPSVKKIPRKTAPRTGLENRGARPSGAQRKERAADLAFRKAETRWEGEYLTRMTGLRGPKGVTSQSTRGQGKRSLRKEAAMMKEAKRKVINSQQNLNKAKKSSADKKALKAANKKRIGRIGFGRGGAGGGVGLFGTRIR